jgi:predicted nucleic acid-binding protein
VSIVVSDTSPLHYLVLCGLEGVLPRLFQQVLIPPTVFAELQHGNAPPTVRSWAAALPEWAAVRAPASLDSTLQVDQGEMEAICLAREVNAAALLIDDAKGRRAAIRCGLAVTGTLGLIEAAATLGLVDFFSAVERLQRTTARIDPELIEAAIERHRQRQRQG